jgi:hypothetical protein
MQIKTHSNSPVNSVMSMLVRPLATRKKPLYFAYNRLGSHIAIAGT